MTVESGACIWSSAVLEEIWQKNAATRAALCDEVRGLSEVQAGFRPAAGRWSIGEILDHVCLAERSITRTASRILQQAAGRGQRPMKRTVCNRPMAPAQSSCFNQRFTGL